MRTDMDVEQHHSIWLTPDTSTHMHLKNTIDDIVEQEGTSSFEPHVTLLGDVFAVPRHTEALCRSAFAEQTVVCARIEGLATTSQFFMSLFVDLEVAPVVHDLRRNLADSLGLDAVQDFRPHLSLAYGLSREAQTRQLTRLSPTMSNGQELILDTLVIASSASQLPVNRWKTITKVKLASL